MAAEGGRKIIVRMTKLKFVAPHRTSQSYTYRNKHILFHKWCVRDTRLHYCSTVVALMLARCNAKIEY